MHNNGLKMYISNKILSFGLHLKLAYFTRIKTHAASIYMGITNVLIMFLFNSKKNKTIA